MEAGEEERLERIGEGSLHCLPTRHFQGALSRLRSLQRQERTECPSPELQIGLDRYLSATFGRSTGNQTPKAARAC
eukprot:10765583-Karenia_brevis.AAC.1